MKKPNQYLLSVISGILLALSFPPYPFPLLAFVGFVPILFVFDKYENIKRPFLLLYITFFIYHVGTNWWIGSFQAKTDPYLTASAVALALGHPFFFMIPFWAFFKAQKLYGNKSAIWLFPWFWVTFEWLHSLGEFSYPWLTIGNTQIYNSYFIQIIDITGVWGSSFIVLCVNVLILKLIYTIRKAKNNNEPLLKNKHSLTYIVLILLIIGIPSIYGFFKLNEFEHSKLIKNNETVNIGLIQPSIDPWDKWEAGVIDQIQMHMRISDSLNNVHGNSLDMLIWSETAIPFSSFKFNYEHHYPFLTNWINSNNFTLMTGFSQAEIYNTDNKPPTARQLHGDTSRYYKMYNAALMLNPYPFDEDNPQMYQKMRLTPVAERFPYADQLTFAQDWLQWGVGISDWGMGRVQHNLTFYNKGRKFDIGSIICIESIYPGFCRNFTNKGADVLSVITNDAWYNYTIGPEQHYLIAAIRAIENRRYIVRCANSGVTGFIAADGSTVLRAPKYEGVGVAASIPLLKGKSVYVLYGDWLPIACTIFSFVVLFLSNLILKRRFI